MGEALALTRARLIELPYTMLVLLWLSLLAAVYAVTLGLQLAGIGLHSTTLGVTVLLARDAIAVLVGLWLWRGTDHGAALFSRLPRLGVWECALLVVVIMLLVIYYTEIYRSGVRQTSSELIFDQRNLSAPLRALLLVAHQQIITVGFLLDTHRERFGDRRGLYATAALFSSTHLFSVMWLDWPSALLLTAASLAGILLWAWLRIAKGAHYAPLLMHYIFYLAMLIR